MSPPRRKHVVRTCARNSVIKVYVTVLWKAGNLAARCWPAIRMDDIKETRRFDTVQQAISKQ